MSRDSNQTMGLQFLLSDLANHKEIADVQINGLSLDSKSVHQGNLFLAYPGLKMDGRCFISQAVARGAAAIAYDPYDFECPQSSIPMVAVTKLQQKLSAIAARFHGDASENLFVIGVTGTNGKTSCVHFLAQCFERLGIRCAVIGTLGQGFLDSLDHVSGLTTPNALELQELMGKFLSDGATHLCMEVSSHALVQGRVNAVRFDVAVFTNLTRDHLDYHSDWADYARAKQSLFSFPSLQFCVVNVDDQVGAQIAQDAEVEALRFGSHAPIRAENLDLSEGGIKMTMHLFDGESVIQTELIGRVNIDNILAVASILYKLNYPLDRLVGILSQLRPVPGRMELFRPSNQVPSVVVDYSHTPDALERALQALREHCAGELWCVFGCGGDRDRGKRAQMGAIAEELSDHVVLTNDNPRSEPPEQIIAEIASGMDQSPTVCEDRKQAVIQTLVKAQPDDWVLIAGKGHEATQTIGSEVIPLSDRQIVQQWLEQAA